MWQNLHFFERSVQIYLMRIFSDAWAKRERTNTLTICRNRKMCAIIVQLSVMMVHLSPMFSKFISKSRVQYRNDCLKPAITIWNGASDPKIRFGQNAHQNNEQNKRFNYSFHSSNGRISFVCRQNTHHFRLMNGVKKSLAHFNELKPRNVIGLTGYMCVPAQKQRLSKQLNVKESILKWANPPDQKST